LTDLIIYTPQFEEKIIHAISDVSVQSIGSKPKAVFGYNGLGDEADGLSINDSWHNLVVWYFIV